MIEAHDAKDRRSLRGSAVLGPKPTWVGQMTYWDRPPTRPPSNSRTRLASTFAAMPGPWAWCCSRC
jgi:hypothetical protein